jgi:hypothetical protein
MTHAFALMPEGLGSCTATRTEPAVSEVHRIPLAAIRVDQAVQSGGAAFPPHERIVPSGLKRQRPERHGFPRGCWFGSAPDVWTVAEVGEWLAGGPTERPDGSEV